MTDMTSAADVDQIVSRANEAYEAGRNASPTARSGWLVALAASLDNNADELVHLAHEETSLALDRLTGELNRTTFQLRLFAQAVLEGMPLNVLIDYPDQDWPMGARPDIRRMNVPLGTVGVFGSSNFPFAFSVFGGDTASALAAGCSVVHKIHEAHEKLALRVAEIGVQALSSAGAPEGLFSIVLGREAGERLVDHSLTKAVAFTGSTKVGRLLMERAAARPEPIPFYGELGSINPVFITKAAWEVRKDQVLDQFLASYTLGMGQFCTKPGLLFVPSLDIKTRSELKQRVEAVEGSPMLTTTLAEGYHRSRTAMVQREGIEVLVSGGSGRAPAPTLLITQADTVLEDTTILEEELFGPASIIIEYENEAQLSQIAREIGGQLTATLQAEPHEDLTELVLTLEQRVGRLIWNSWPTGVIVSYAQQHGGPYPATTASSSTSVGTEAVHRFTRPVAYQSFPDHLLPQALQNDNPWALQRRVNGESER